ncbi:MAG: DUF4232 domain-containing protein [Candidatus Limnocylindrales bacterium]
MGTLFMRLSVLLAGFALVVAGCASPPTLEPSSAPASAGPASAAPSTGPIGQASAVPSTGPDGNPTPTPTPKPIAACLAAQLAAKVTGWQGATGHQIANVTLTNTSNKVCTVQGTPEVELVDARGNILIDSQTSGPAGLPHIAKGAPAFHLAHLGALTTQVNADNYCGAAPALPTTVAFVLPANGGRLVAAKGPGGTVPPCSRAPGTPGTIVMSGWKK